VKSQHKFLLTGTPVQNNLSELLTLVSFLNPALFSKYQSSESDHQLVDHFDYELKRNLEKKGLPMDDDHRLAAARTVLLPFVLRRVKADVDTGLLEKQILVEECALGATHRAAYAEVEVWLAEAEAATKQAAAERLERGRKKPGSSKAKAKANQQAELPASSLNNRDMQLRKAANHPLLHRRLFDSAKLSQVASVLLSAAEASAVAAASAAAAAAVAAAERACTMPKLTKGLRIQVLWADPDGGEEGGTWFTGTVSAAPKSGKAAVEYDDGEKAVLVLADEEYRVLAPVGGDGGDDAAASMGSAAGAYADNGDGDVDVDVDGDGNGGEGEDDEGAIPWQTSGHSHIGCLALRHCEDDDGTQRKQEGRITMWAPADEAEGDPALWHMVHDDGDEEDLEEEEVEEALQDWKRENERAPPQKNQRGKRAKGADAGAGASDGDGGRDGASAASAGASDSPSKRARTGPDRALLPVRTVWRADGMDETALRAEPAEDGAWHAADAVVCNGECAQVEAEEEEPRSGARFALLLLPDGRRGWLKVKYLLTAPPVDEPAVAVPANDGHGSGRTAGAAMVPTAGGGGACPAAPAVGSLVVRVFEDSAVLARVVERFGEGPERLWHVEHADGDGEDLDDEEMVEALADAALLQLGASQRTDSNARDGGVEGEGESAGADTEMEMETEAGAETGAALASCDGAIAAGAAVRSTVTSTEDKEEEEEEDGAFERNARRLLVVGARIVRVCEGEALAAEVITVDPPFSASSPPPASGSAAASSRRWTVKFEDGETEQLDQGQLLLAVLDRARQVAQEERDDGHRSSTAAEYVQSVLGRHWQVIAGPCCSRPCDSARCNACFLLPHTVLILRLDVNATHRALEYADWHICDSGARNSCGRED
jgi:hypothetical protein